MLIGQNFHPAGCGRKQKGPVCSVSIPFVTSQGVKSPDGGCFICIAAFAETPEVLLFFLKKEEGLETLADSFCAPEVKATAPPGIAEV